MGRAWPPPTFRHPRAATSPVRYTPRPVNGPPPEDRPRPLRWRRTDAPLPKPDDAPPPALSVAVPPGDPRPAEDLDAAVARTLAHWPIAHLRLVGHLRQPAQVGMPASRFLARRIHAAVDACCRCPGPWCGAPSCPSALLLGRRQKGRDAVIDPWAPFALRGSSVESGKHRAGHEVRASLTLAGGRAISAAPSLAAALREAEGDVEWSAIQAMAWEDGELRWRNVEPGACATLPLDLIDDPPLRAGRLTLALLSPAVLGRPRDRGRPVANLPLWVDRACRTLMTWADATGHRAPPLPREELLRVAARASLHSEAVRTADLPAVLVDPTSDRDDRIAGLFGTATWTGDLGGLGVLLRAAAHCGIGPGRALGLGEFGMN